MCNHIPRSVYISILYFYTDITVIDDYKLIIIILFLVFEVARKILQPQRTRDAMLILIPNANAPLASVQRHVVQFRLKIQFCKY